VTPGLRVLEGGAVLEDQVTRDPWEFQALCVDAFVASWRVRGFSPVTIGNDSAELERVLKALGRPAWDVTPEDIDRVVGDLAVAGRTTSTRRGYVQVFKGFHRFLQVRKAAEIEAAFGVRLVCPVDEFNASRHVGDDSPAELPPPAPERVSEFFEFLKGRIATARKYAPAARDYALYRTLYHAGLRSEEAALLDRPDVHFSLGPFGKLHVRFGKAAHTSGPRPRWVPMLDGLDLVLRWFTDDVRGKFPDSAVLFADESGGALHPGTIRNRLRHLMELEGRPAAGWFSPHALRRACATHNYERGVDLVAIQQLLGHWTVSSTMRYVRHFLGHVHRGCLPAGGGRHGRRADRAGADSMNIRWKLRMAAAQREVWTGTQRRRLLAEKAGLELSAASVSALFTREPAQVKLSTLAALCTALECTPDDLFEVDTTPVARPAALPRPAGGQPEAAPARGRSMPPL